jgi:hypothetical protein
VQQREGGQDWPHGARELRRGRLLLEERLPLVNSLPWARLRLRRTPRSIHLEPDGRFLLSAGEDSGKLAVFGVNLDNGKLTRLQSYDVGKSLTWVIAVKLTAK